MTSSYRLLRAKWSIRQASYTTRCSLKNVIPTRINNWMLWNWIKCYISWTRSDSSSELTSACSLRINEDKRVRSTRFHCLAATAVFIFKTSTFLQSLDQQWIPTWSHKMPVWCLQCCYNSRLNILFRAHAGRSFVSCFLERFSMHKNSNNKNN